MRLAAHLLHSDRLGEHRLIPWNRAVAVLDRGVRQMAGNADNEKAIGRSESRESAMETADELDGAESSLKRVMDAIPALAWCANPDGSMEFLNRQWHDYTGLSPAETRDWGYQAAFHPEDRQNGIDESRERFSKNGPAEREIRLRRYDGIYRWFLIRVEPLRDETGKVIRWYGISTD